MYFNSPRTLLSISVLDAAAQLSFFGKVVYIKPSFPDKVVYIKSAFFRQGRINKKMTVLNRSNRGNTPPSQQTISPNGRYREETWRYIKKQKLIIYRIPSCLTLFSSRFKILPTLFSSSIPVCVFWCVFTTHSSVDVSPCSPR